MKTLKVLLQEVVSGIKAWVNSNFAQESNTVHKTGNETVNGVKTFSNILRSTSDYEQVQTTGFDVRTDPEAARGRDIFKVWDSNGSISGDYLGGMSYFQETDGSSRLQLICFGYPTTGNPSQQRINFHAYRDGTGSFYPVRNDVNLGSSTYQWNNLYAKNYYYKGIQWGLDKYNWWSLAQFYAQNSIHVRNVEPGVAPSSDVSAGIRFENANASYVFADIVGKVFTSGTTFVNLIASNKFTNGALDPNGTNVSKNFQIGVRPDGSGFIYTDCGWRNNLVPHSMEQSLSLGTSTNKWRYVNGLNPGSLSFPSEGLTANKDYINIASAILPTGENATNFDNTKYNYYTPSVDGWLALSVKNCSYLSVWSPAMKTGQIAIAPDTTKNQQIMMPVVAGKQLEINIYGDSWHDARLIVPKGNIFS